MSPLATDFRGRRQWWRGQMPASTSLAPWFNRWTLVCAFVHDDCLRTLGITTRILTFLRTNACSQHLAKKVGCFWVCAIICFTIGRIKLQLDLHPHATLASGYSRLPLYSSHVAGDMRPLIHEYLRDSDVAATRNFLQSVCVLFTPWFYPKHTCRLVDCLAAEWAGLPWMKATSQSVMPLFSWMLTTPSSWIPISALDVFQNLHVSWLRQQMRRDYIKLVL